MRATIAAATAAVLLMLAAVVLIVGAGSSGARANDAAVAAAADRTGAFAWLHPAPAPLGWQHATTAASQATLFFPPSWKPTSGDHGTVSRTLRDRRGRYIGYLNITPRQGTEQPHGWAAFRTGHNRAEGDRQIRQVASAENLRFRDAGASCVIDDYLSKVGGNPYQEIACLVTGRHRTDVFIAAALRPDWHALRGTLERAASAFLQR